MAGMEYNISLGVAPPPYIFLRIPCKRLKFDREEWFKVNKKRKEERKRRK